VCRRCLIIYFASVSGYPVDYPCYNFHLHKESQTMNIEWNPYLKLNNCVLYPVNHEYVLFHLSFMNIFRMKDVLKCNDLDSYHDYFINILFSCDFCFLNKSFACSLFGKSSQLQILATNTIKMISMIILPWYVLNPDIFVYVVSLVESQKMLSTLMRNILENSLIQCWDLRMLIFLLKFILRKLLNQQHNYRWYLLRKDRYCLL